MPRLPQINFEFFLLAVREITRVRGNNRNTKEYHFTHTGSLALCA